MRMLFLLLSVLCQVSLGQPVQGVPGASGLEISGDSGSPKVAVELVPQYIPAAAGHSFALAVVLDVPDGWHLYANPRQGEFGLDTEIIPQSVEYLRFGRVIYAAGEEYVDKNLNASNHIYTGRNVCYVPVEIVSGMLGSAVLRLELKGQLCSDTGTCMRWGEKAFVELAVVSDITQVRGNQPDLFSGIDLAETRRKTDEGHPNPATKAVRAESEAVSDNWLKPILLALAAGLIMNLMPCVLPIIPIVVMALVNRCRPDEGQPPDRGQSVKVGLAFAAGVMIVFVGLAVIMSVFKLIWGQHFQSNTFKFVLLMIVYVLSLSMFGLFEIVLPASVSNISITRKGYLGVFLMGVLATVLATPCGAPLLTPVLTFSLSKPLVITIVVFLIIGVGMAAPYVLLTAFPGLLNRVPRGGNWMIRLRQAIGFAMLGFAAYLLVSFPLAWWGPLLYFCILVGFCVWLGFSVADHSASPAKRMIVRVIALILIVAGSVALAMAPKTSDEVGTGISWLVQLENHKRQGRSVIVKFTADWCKNCAVLNKLIYKSKSFRDKMDETNTALVVADWSGQDADIKKMISELGGRSLPFAAVFPASAQEKPIILRDFYSLKDTLSALDQAAEGGDSR